MCIVMVISSRYDLVMVGSARGANKSIKAGESYHRRVIYIALKSAEYLFAGLYYQTVSHSKSTYVPAPFLTKVTLLEGGWMIAYLARPGYCYLTLGWIESSR